MISRNRLRTKAKKISKETLLVEYQQIRQEIDGYYKSRSSILAIIISATGIILGFSTKEDPSLVLLALYVVINIGGLLTYAFTYEAKKREVYVKVFIEDRIKELKWFSALEIEIFEPSIIHKLTRWLKLPIDGLPHEYPIVFLLLLLVIDVYAYKVYTQFHTSYYLIIIIVGSLLILYIVFILQYIASSKKTSSLISEWENIYNKMNGSFYD